MDEELKKIALENTLNNLYKNNFFTIKSICEHLNIWDNYTIEEKLHLENLTFRDSQLNKNFDFIGKYDKNLTYGEILRPGVEKLIEHIYKIKRDLSPSDVFVDIGSGTGKLLIHSAFLLPVKTYVGIEIVEERVKYSKHILEQFTPGDNKKIFFINKDVRDFDLSIAKIVFCNNTYFDDKLVEEIFNKLPVGCHLITAKPVNCKYLKDIFRLEVTWNDRPFGFRYYIK